MADEGYPHVRAWQRDIVVRYGHHLQHTGGNDPLRLLDSLNRPGSSLARLNPILFTFAMVVDAQVALLREMEKQGALRPGRAA